MIDLEEIKKLKLEKSRQKELVDILGGIDIPSTEYTVYIFKKGNINEILSYQNVGFLITFPDSFPLSSDLTKEIRYKVSLVLGDEFSNAIMLYSEGGLNYLSSRFPNSFEGKVVKRIIKVKVCA